MHRGLADPEFFGGGADGRPVFYEVKGQLLGPLFQILSDRAPLLTVGWSIYMSCREQLCPQKRAEPHTQKVCGPALYVKERVWQSKFRPRLRCRHSG